MVSKLTRQDRVSMHKKQERTLIKNGVPAPGELRNGIPEVRYVASLGVVEYIKFNDVLYRNIYDRV